MLLALGIGHAAIGPAAAASASFSTDNLTGIATLIFTTYVFPFEVTGALLITAALGAMVLAHRERATPRPTQREIAARRVASGQLAPDPSPAFTRCTTPRTGRPCCRTAPRRNRRSARCCRRVTRTKDHGSFRREGRSRSRPKAASGSPPRGPVREGRRMSPVHYVALSVILFVIGGVGVLVRRNAIVVFMCIELMLNACNLAFVAFARMHGNLDGQVIAFFVMVVAAAEVVVGLAILMAIFRARRSASVDDANLLKY